jgi:hypothetical protein
MNQFVATPISRPVSAGQMACVSSRAALPADQKPVSTTASKSAALLKQFAAVLLRSLSSWAV